jgi:cytidyltransferase-like protein
MECLFRFLLQPSRMRVLVFGTFDLLHPGHRYLLAEAAKRGELNVVVARDRNVERIKGKTTVHSEEERLAAVRAAAPSARAMLGDREDFLAPVRAVQPDLILLGYDQKLPPGVTEDAFPCPVERLPAFEPEKWKSSILRRDAGK